MAQVTPSAESMAADFYARPAEEKAPPVEEKAPPKGPRRALDALDATIKRIESEGGAIKPKTTEGSRDPYVRYVVNPVSETVGPHLPSWANTAARYALPQTSPELAAQAALYAVGGPLGLAGKGVLPIAERVAGKALASGAASGLAGYLTGYNPKESAAKGALGGVAGGTVSEVAESVVQRAVVNRMADSTLGRMANVLRRLPLFKGAEKETASEVVRQAMRGTPAAAIESQIADLGKRAGKVTFNPALPEIMAAMKKVPREGETEVSFAKLWQHAPELRPMLARSLSPELQQEYATLLKGHETVQAIQSWVMGGHKTPERAWNALFDNRGRLTVEGWAELYGRLAMNKDEMLKGLGGEVFGQLSRALYQDLALGMERINPGRAPGLVLGKKSPATIGIPGIPVRIDPGSAPWAPGWASQATSAEVNAPKVLRGATPNIPLKLAPPEEER